MSQEPGIERGGASIARASKRKWGYDADQVDAFLERAHALYESDEATLTQRDIQNVSFDLAKGGYDIVQVDAALSRLERAVVDKQTTRQIGEHGRVAWKAQTEDLYRQLASHASRVHGERFNRGQKKRPSYDLKQVDRLIDDVIDKSAAELGVDGTSDQLPKKLQELKSSDVSNAVFTQRKGKRGYDERQVDFFLNSCVQLLSRLESYARVADYVQSEGESAAPIASKAAVSGGASSAGTPGVAPLFAADPQRQQPGAESGADGSPSSASADNESFDALHQAEQAFFPGFRRFRRGCGLRGANGRVRRVGHPAARVRRSLVRAVRDPRRRSFRLRARQLRRARESGHDRAGCIRASIRRRRARFLSQNG